MSVSLTGLTWNDPRGYGPWDAVPTRSSHSKCCGDIVVQWDVQPLRGFESKPIHEVARQYDVFVMDHPQTIEAATRKCIVPIGDLDNVYLGPCRESYTWDGQQWAVPIDAACHVAAYRPHRLARLPTCWTDVFDLAANGVRVTAPLEGVHALMALLTLLASKGSPVGTQSRWPRDTPMREALHILRRLVDTASTDALHQDPIESLEALVADRCDYIPLIFGYAHYQSRGVRFAKVPACDDSHCGVAILGGTGIAVSARCANRDAAIAFARRAGSETIQVHHWSPYGGQPAHRSAWDVLSRQDAFYDDTREAMETAYVRPRFFGWNKFQTKAGDLINHWLSNHNDSVTDLCCELRQLWDSAVVT